MIIRWKFVAPTIVLALVLVALVNRKTATAAPQASLVKTVGAALGGWWRCGVARPGDRAAGAVVAGVGEGGANPLGAPFWFPPRIGGAGPRVPR